MPLPRYRQNFYSGYFPQGVKWLILVNCAVFLIYYLGGRSGQEHMLTIFALSEAAAIKNFYVWQVVTYMFLHGGFTHLLFNMLSLWFFGVQLERDWGTRRFLKYFFYCGVAAGICVLAVNAMVGDYYTPTLGASGAIFGILVAFGILYPEATVLMGFLFPIRAKYMVMIYAAIELVVTFGPNTGVSTVAHLGGMAFGYLYLKRRLPSVPMPDWGGAYRQWKMQRAKKKFQVYMKNRGGGRGPWVN
jgi:membrane associated rhomboid family serine protease